MDNKANLIYLADNMLISKKEYSDWREFQDEYYEKFTTSLPPATLDKRISFF